MKDRTLIHALLRRVAADAEAGMLAPTLAEELTLERALAPEYEVTIRRISNDPTVQITRRRRPAPRVARRRDHRTTNYHRRSPRRS